MVQNHFFGKFGLQAELIDVGVMDPETKVERSSGTALYNAPSHRAEYIPSLLLVLAHTGDIGSTTRSQLR